MADFNFITVPELRQSLESDYRELRGCLKAEAWKAVHVLSGSIVEAILIDALSGTVPDPATLDRLELGPLIVLAKENGILPDEAVDLSTVIRKYRNLIHPGRVKRLEKTVDRSGAIVAAEVVEIITKEVAKKKQETYGFTAEQLLERLRSGASALPLVVHLLSDTPKAEIERLLIDVLPKAYFDAVADQNSTPDEDSHLQVCYRKVFDAAEKDVRIRVTKNVYKVYRTKPEPTVLVYEEQFFRGSDLAYLSENERRFIKAHFLPRISAETLGDLLYNIVGIGPFLDTDEAATLIEVLIAGMHSDDEDLVKRARARLLNEYSKMAVESRTAVHEIVAAYGYMEIVANLEKREAKIEPVRSGESASA
jgi:hypothetical protein